MTPCPLCFTQQPHQKVTGADNRTYYHCANCALIFADPSHFLSRETEKSHYLTHENHIHNAGYVRFLNQVLEPLLPHLDNSMRALDYGCGPGPTLSQLLRQRGITCDDYDPLFANVPLHPPYDVIFATECFEHFHHPEKEIQRIVDLLKPGAWLGIMTECWSSITAFPTWYYSKDPTHVCFYHADTFDYLCRRYGLVQYEPGHRRVVILRKHS